MPASRSPSRAAKAAPRRQFWLPVVLIGLAALLVVTLAALPASVISHFLPPMVHAEDFSGSLWHGAAGKISVSARDAGAVEWRLHPAALLALKVVADLHWVKTGFVLDGVATLDPHGFTAHAVKGAAPSKICRISALRPAGTVPRT